MPKTRKERRERQRINYFEGRARRPYRHTPFLEWSLTEDSEASSSDGICPQCRPILSCYSQTFGEMVHTGTELKRKKVNTSPKHVNSIPYRDVKQQNEWIRSNIFDSMGNYLYSCACLCAALKISKQAVSSERYKACVNSHNIRL